MQRHRDYPLLDVSVDCIAAGIGDDEIHSEARSMKANQVETVDEVTCSGAAERC